MKSITPLLVLLLMAGPYCNPAPASSTLRLTTKEQVSAATAICRGTVVQVTSFRDERDHGIKTEAWVHIDESLKGILPAVLRLVYEGGTLEETGVLDGFSPRLRPGDRRLLFLERRADGYVGVAGGFAGAFPLPTVNAENDPLVVSVRSLVTKGRPDVDLRDQGVDWAGTVPAAPVNNLDSTGLLVDLGTGVPSRYLPPDRGEPLEYLVDTQTLPAGLNVNQCLGAVSNAFAAWAAVTGIEFKFGGLQFFGQAAATVSISDQRLRVQLHDQFNYITTASTLGRGGRSYAIAGAFPNGGMGGKVGDQEFYPNNYGYVVLNHRATAMQTLTTFEEVLCHEIGHALGMAHSSENPAESNTTLRQAVMYYQAHADGRGAALGIYDPPIVQKAYPPANTPPYGYDRVMDIVTASPQPNVAGVNSVQLNGFDLQNDPLTVTLSGATLPGNGTFSLAGNLLRYTAAQAWSDVARFDPAGTASRGSIYARFSDGVHESPYVRVRVLSFSFDNLPATSDGIPNWWAQQYFGNPAPLAANLSRAQDDKDGDGLTNLEEWLAGTDPTVATSNLNISGFDGTTLDFAARPYELYEVLATTDFTSWSRVNNPVLPTASTGSATGLGAASGRGFFQVRRVP